VTDPKLVLGESSPFGRREKILNKRAELKKQFLKRKDITVKSQKQESKLSLEADFVPFLLKIDKTYCDNPRGRSLSKIMASTIRYDKLEG